MSVKLDGKLVSEEIYCTVKNRVQRNARNKTMAIVTIGDDEASKVYVNNKKKKIVECGMKYQHISLSENTNLFELEELVKMLNDNDYINGIIIQKPLTPSLKKYEYMIDTWIDPEKDVDGFSPVSVHKSCTPKGIMTLLDYYLDCSGKNVVIAGRSKIVAQPLADMFMERNCTVTMIHSHTSDSTVRNLIANCDIFVSAIGRPHYWTKDYFNTNKKYLALVDVGINRVYSGNTTKIVGDIDPEVYNLSEYYTPVPGGVGLMTVATLINNLSNSK